MKKTSSVSAMDFATKRSPHQALDALFVGTTKRKVNWIIDWRKRKARGEITIHRKTRRLWGELDASGCSAAFGGVGEVDAIHLGRNPMASFLIGMDCGGTVSTNRNRYSAWLAEILSDCRIGDRVDRQRQVVRVGVAIIF